MINDLIRENLVRECRYLVTKIKDAELALDTVELYIFNKLLNKIKANRQWRGKIDLACVVIESDWPEYERVWEMIAERVKNEQPK